MSITMENIERNEELRSRVIEELALELKMTPGEAEAIHKRAVLMTRVLRLGGKLDRISKMS